MAHNERIIEQASSAATYVGTTAAVTLWGLSISDVAVIVSTTVAVLGFALHLWLSIRRERREKVRHTMTVTALALEIERGCLTSAPK